MKKLNLIKVLLFFCLPFFALGQKSINDFIHLDNKITSKNGFISLKKELKIDPTNVLKVQKISTFNGIKHTRFNQYFKGYRIVGTGFIVHETLGKVKVNGEWVKGFSKNIKISISSKNAIVKALSSFEYKKLCWESEGMENQLKRIKGPEATYYPSPKLVWYDKNMSKSAPNYQLAYEMDIDVLSPLVSYKVYIDAVSGLLINKYITSHTFNVPAQGTSYYQGEVEIVVDSIAPDDFALEESLRHGHSNISTIDFNEGDLNVVHDSNNVWGEENEIIDRIAVDAHWGAEMTVDYFHDYHNRMGIDDNGGDVSLIVNYAPGGQPFMNATYGGGVIRMGGGNGVIGPFTELSIVAHEFAHGVTASEALLIYQGESGAINESMSDVFGVTVKHFMTGEHNWIVGGDINYPLRKMNDPKSFGMASTYGGEFWYEDSDVHINSSIGNLWFSFLVEGGEGENDFGYNYNIEPLGFETASQIVYQALTNYLTPSSDYCDYRNVTLEIAANMFGENSFEFGEVYEAWQAVGVKDFYNVSLLGLNSPVTGCGFDQEIISIDLVFHSCGDSLATGFQFPIYYSINMQDTIEEIVTLPYAMFDNDVLLYTFSALADMSEIDIHDVNIWMELEAGSYNQEINNKHFEVENKLYQNEDFSIFGIGVNDPDLCDTNLDGWVCVVQYWGCDPIPQGTLVQLNCTLGDISEIKTFELVNTYQNGSHIVFIVTDFGELIGTDNQLSVEVLYPNDPFPDNNFLQIDINQASLLTDQTIIEFVDSFDINKFLIKSGDFVKDNEVQLKERFDIENDSMMFISGGVHLTYQIMEPSSNDGVWDVNKKFIREISLCINAESWENVYLGFDLRMQVASVFYNSIGLNPIDYCNFRIMINDEPIAETFNVDLDDYTFNEYVIDLSDYAGTSFSLTFQAQTINSLEKVAPYGDVNGDDISLDNIWIGPSDITLLNEILYSNLEIEVYPNPVNEFINVNLKSNSQKIVSCKLFDVNNKLMIDEIISDSGSSLIINTKEMVSGMYYLKIMTNDGYNVFPIIKINQ